MFTAVLFIVTWDVDGLSAHQLVSGGTYTLVCWMDTELRSNRTWDKRAKTCVVLGNTAANERKLTPRSSHILCNPTHLTREQLQQIA